MIIYKATNKINSMSYIGQTIRTLNERKNEHMGTNSNTYFTRALKKYSKNNFDWDIINECDNIDELNRLEIYYIGWYDTYNNGYNLTLGGEGQSGFKHSEETKKKMSKNHADVLGKKNPMFGKKRPDLVAKNKQVKYVGENNGMFGKKRPDLVERNKNNKGKKYPKRSGKNNNQSKSIILIHPNNFEEKFDCIKDAENKYNLSGGNLSKVAKGKRKSCGGFKCKYANKVVN